MLPPTLNYDFAWEKFNTEGEVASAKRFENTRTPAFWEMGIAVDGKARQKEVAIAMLNRFNQAPVITNRFVRFDATQPYRVLCTGAFIGSKVRWQTVKKPYREEFGPRDATKGVAQKGALSVDVLGDKHSTLRVPPQNSSVWNTPRFLPEYLMH